MQPIETRYKGYRFRSRLEARWAVFFDEMGMLWSYETQGYEFDGVRYLPDFTMPGNDGIVMFYEVKPDTVALDPKFAAFEAAYDRAHDGQAEFTLLNGDPYALLVEGSLTLCPGCGFITAGCAFWHDSEQFRRYCFNCDASQGTSPHPLTEVGFHKGDVTLEEDVYFAFLRRVREAAEKARAARFEHGESPA